MSSFVQRVVGASLLKPVVFEEIEADTRATPQAMLVVLLSSAAAGVGGYAAPQGGLTMLVGISLLAFAAWALWAMLTYQIGARIMPAPETRADIGQLLRVIGFASAPGVLRIAAVIPGTARAVFAITAVWMLAAMIVGVRQALDYSSTARAVAVCTLGWLLAVGFVFVIGLLWAPPLY